MSVRVLTGDARDVLATLPEKHFHTVVTSPPYFGLRSYGIGTENGEIGLEPTPDEFVAALVAAFREVKRVLRDDGTVWLNLGDSYSGSGPSGASYQSKTTKARADKDTDGNFRISKTLGQRGLTYAEKKPIPPPGLKPKDLIGIPWMVAFALRADGWYLRQDIIWSKPNPMPESVRDRCTKAHEYLFMLSKSARYYYDAEAIREPSSWDPGNSKMPDGWDTGPGAHGAFHRQGREKGRKSDKQRGHSRHHDGFNDRWDAMEKAGQCANGRNKRSVWEISPAPFREAHFATFPPALVEPCIKAGCPSGGHVLDPFGGAGTTGLVADRLQRHATLIELNPAYADMARSRLATDGGLFAEVAAE